MEEIGKCFEKIETYATSSLLERKLSQLLFFPKFGILAGIVSAFVDDDEDSTGEDETENEKVYLWDVESSEDNIGRRVKAECSRVVELNEMVSDEKRMSSVSCTRWKDDTMVISGFLNEESGSPTSPVIIHFKIQDPSIFSCLILSGKVPEDGMYVVLHPMNNGLLALCNEEEFMLYSLDNKRVEFPFRKYPSFEIDVTVEIISSVEYQNCVYCLTGDRDEIVLFDFLENVMIKTIRQEYSERNIYTFAVFMKHGHEHIIFGGYDGIFVSSHSYMESTSCSEIAFEKVSTTVWYSTIIQDTYYITLEAGRGHGRYTLYFIQDDLNLDPLIDEEVFNDDELGKETFCCNPLIKIGKNELTLVLLSMIDVDDWDGEIEKESRCSIVKLTNIPFLKYKFEDEYYGERISWFKENVCNLSSDLFKDFGIRLSISHGFEISLPILFSTFSMV